MRIRLIGLGETGQRIVLKTVQSFRTNGLLNFLEQTRVVRLSTREFVDTFVALRDKAGAARPPATPRELLALRVSLGEVFFGTPHPESDTHRKVLEALGRRMSPPDKRDFERAEQAGLERHRAVMRPLTAELGDRWLIVPRVPLVSEPFPLGNAVAGLELMNAIPEADYRNGLLIRGLGTSESGVDLVVIAFDARNAFGAEGAATLCTAIRRVLMARRANRIVCILGLAMLPAQGDYATGRLIGDYVRLTRRENWLFDGLLLRPTGEQPEAEIPLTLMGLALSSNPQTIQTDNPDANQLQRDFGRSLVGFGAASAADVVPPPPPPPQGQAAAMPAPDPPGQIERLTARKVIACIGYDGKLSGQELKALRQQLAQDFPHARPVIYKYRLLGVRGDTVKESAPEAGPSLLQLYAAALERWARSHCVVGTPLQQQFAQEVGANPWANIPWIQSLAHAGQHPPGVEAPARYPFREVGHAPPPRDDHPGVVGALWDRFAGKRPVELPPLRRHLILFVVDSFETRAVEAIAAFLVEQGEVFDAALAIPAWISLADVQQPGRAEQRKRCFLARSLVSLPDTKQNWTPPLVQQSPRSYAQGHTLSQPDPAYLDELKKRVNETLRGEQSGPYLQNLGMTFSFECPTENFELEADAVADTLDMVPVFLSRFLKPTLRERDWVTEVLGGLNLLCNEQVPPRRVGSSVGDLFVTVHG